MIDSFHRIRALHKAGIRIHLHCFEYGRPRAEELTALCVSVNYYKRSRSLTRHFSGTPYIVASRDAFELPERLLDDDHPILFDGLHTTSFLGHPSFASRRKIVRAHNIEHEYYRTLARQETNLFKSMYFSSESNKLKRYERVLKKADIILALSEKDQEYFEGRYGNAELVFPFHQYDDPETKEGSGEYIIWHGDMSVNENRLVAEYLIKTIFPRIPYKCIIAGKDPTPRLQKLAMRYENIIIAGNPGNEEMSDLIREAHINLLAGLSTHGMKIKLLNALFAGRHCVVNSNMVSGTRLGPACMVEDSAAGIIRIIDQLMSQPFTGDMADQRRLILEPYSNTLNATKLINLIFS